jgi:hypothetical protein
MTKLGVCIFFLCSQALFSCRFVLTPTSFDLSAEIFPESQERAEAAIAKVRVESTASDASPLDRRRLPAISFFLHRPYKDCRLASIKATGHRYQDLQVPLA